MAKLGCAKCGGKMAKGGSASLKYGIPNSGTTNYSAPTMKLGGAAKAKLAGMAAPKNKITRADIITAIKKKVKKKK